MNQNNVWQEYLKAVPELQAPFEAQCRENWVDGTDGPYAVSYTHLTLPTT